MMVSDLGNVFARLCETDPAVLDRDGLAEYAKDTAVLRSWLASKDVAAARRNRELEAQGRSEAVKDLFVRDGGQSGRESRATAERERVCSAMPGVEDALAAGSVSAGHVDALANASRGLDEPTMAEFASHTVELLADASGRGVDEFERGVSDGLCKGSGSAS